MWNTRTQLQQNSLGLYEINTKRVNGQITRSLPVSHQLKRKAFDKQCVCQYTFIPIMHKYAHSTEHDKRMHKTHNRLHLCNCMLIVAKRNNLLTVVNLGTKLKRKPRLCYLSSFILQEEIGYSYKQREKELNLGVQSRHTWAISRRGHSLQLHESTPRPFKTQPTLESHIQPASLPASHHTQRWAQCLRIRKVARDEPKQDTPPPAPLLRVWENTADNKNRTHATKHPAPVSFVFPSQWSKVQKGDSLVEKTQLCCCGALSCEETCLVFIYFARLLQSWAYRAYLETPAAQRKDTTQQTDEMAQ